MAQLLLEARAALDGSADGQRPTVELPQCLEEMADQGVDVAAFLRDEYRRSTRNVQRATVVIMALGMTGGAEAKEALQDIALSPGLDGETLGPRAVRAYAELSGSSGEIAQLLNSHEPYARDAAIRAMHGLPLDRSAVDALGFQARKSDSWVTQNLIAGTLASDAQQGAVRRKVDILVSASTHLSELKEADGIVARTGFTARETALSVYVGSLARMAGSGPVLEGYLSDPRPLPRALAVIALADQGQRRVHDEVVAIARQSQDGFLRTSAVYALGKVVTRQDQAWLEQLARSDPYRRPSVVDARRPGAGHVGADGRWRYPVREAATEVLRKLR